MSYFMITEPSQNHPDYGRNNKILARLISNTSYVFRGYKDQSGNPSKCYEWQGTTSGNGRGGGYGRISIDSCTCAVHRVAFVLFFGYLPAKKQVDHLCKNRLCWNPEHLQSVTHKQNQKRRVNSNG